MRWSGNEVTRSITDWLLPRRCLLCDAPAGAANLCDACRLDLPRLAQVCPRCAMPVSSPGLCAVCVADPPSFDAALAPLEYTGAARYLLTRFKFHGGLAHGVPLVRLMIELALARPVSERPEALLPVPIHAHRLRERGFNQALELARPVARALGIPLLSDALARKRSTPPQMSLSESARRANVRGAFELRAIVPARVALVDDVLTTGATAAELARVLKRHGCERVEIWCACRSI